MPPQGGPLFSMLFKNGHNKGGTVIGTLGTVLLLLPLAGGSAATHQAIRVDDAPVIDGRLVDPCWALANPWEGFTQRDPSPGEASTEQTNVHLVYTEHALYVAFECFDTQMDRVVARLRHRDMSVYNDDNIDFWVDPTGTGRQLYYFSTNPAGVKYDSFYTNRANYRNEQWDAHWNLATATEDDRWIAEFEIPFTNFKFESDVDRPWLFNAGRVIRRSGEETYIVSVPYDHSMFFTEDAVRLTGFDGIAAGVGIKLVPYSKSDFRHYPELSGDDENDFTPRAGVDVDVDIGRNLTLASAFFPDFAEIDLDPDQYQIGLDQVFVPETRPFFLRDVNYFRTVDFMPFYSRRIGKRLFDDNGIYQDADIVAGARLTGKTGPFGIGGFYAHTQEALWEPESDWGVARLTYDTAPNSYVGAMATGRAARTVTYQGSEQEAYEFASLGADFEHFFGENSWNSWGALVVTNDTRFEKNRFDEQYGATLGVGHRRDGFQVWGRYRDTAERFTTDETGYLDIGNLRSFRGGAGYQFGFGNALFRNLALEVEGGQDRQRDWGRGLDQYEVSARTLTRFNWRFSLTGMYGEDYLYYGPGQRDAWTLGILGLSTDPAGKAQLNAETWYGSLADYTTLSWGRLFSERAEVALHPLSRLGLTGVLRYSKWWMRDGEPSEDYDVTIWQGIAEYLFTRELFFRLFGQGSDQTDLYTFRALLGWEFLPDSNIYLAYEQWRDDSEDDFELVNQAVFLKIDYFLQY